MNKYTVVLLRPEYLLDGGEEYGQEIYVALVTAADTTRALQIAQVEVTNADLDDKKRVRDSEDYKLCVMFEGHHKPKLFGWQL